jgi:hypothetical protein
MPTPAISLKLKRFRRHFGIAAPRVVVRRHLVWQWWVLIGVFAFVFVLVLASFLARDTHVTNAQLEELREVVRAQGEELRFLRSAAGTGLSQVEMERATRQKLQARIQGLEQENAALKEDVLLFERLVPAGGDEQSVRIENFSVVQEESVRYRYRLFLAFQAGKQGGEFKGRLQLLVLLNVSGKEQRLELPAEQGAAADFLLSVRHFLRRDGVFQVPTGAVVSGVEIRVLQEGVVKARRMVKL